LGSFILYLCAALVAWIVSLLRVSGSCAPENPEIFQRTSPSGLGCPQFLGSGQKPGASGASSPSRTLESGDLEACRMRENASPTTRGCFLSSEL
jgi:hypothetical protein